MARPMPRPPPVTTATDPDSETESAGCMRTFSLENEIFSTLSPMLNSGRENSGHLPDTEPADSLPRGRNGGCRHLSRVESCKVISILPYTEVRTYNPGLRSLQSH